MTEPMHGMNDEQRALVRHILGTWVPGHEVRVFGSRAHGHPKAYSDLDLVIMAETPIPMATMGQLQDAFANRDLPWRVDVIEWASTSPEFQRHIQASSVSLSALN